MTTPAREKAIQALTNRGMFCNVIAEARRHKHPNAWSGSAYYKHPCGLIDKTIKMTNDWTTFDSCRIEITDGEGWSLNICRDSLGHGDPNPSPINGRAVTVWSGTWQSDTFREKLEEKCLAILEEAILFSERKQEEHDEEERQNRARMQQKRKEIEDAALAKIA